MVPCIHNSPSIYIANSVGVLFNDVLAEFPSILVFSPVPPVIKLGWLVGGGGEPRSGG